MDKISLNKGWRFFLGNEPNADGRGFDDSEWKKVTVPHDWSVEGDFSKSNSSGTAYLQGGTGWYRVHFKLPEEYRGKKLWVRFEGVYRNSMVWVNSYYMGKHPYGYTPFSYDVSSFVYFGEEDNVIAVKVSREETADSRWYPGTGITRDVNIYVAEQVFIAPEETAFNTVAVDGNKAEVTVKTAVVNSLKEKKNIKTVCRIIDNIGSESTGAELASSEQTETVDGNDTGAFCFDLCCTGVSLWSTKAPKLYTLQLETVADGAVSDIYEVKVGMRTAVFTPDEGFFINGENDVLKGVCVHHDAGCLGAAVPREVWERRLIKLKDMGCNAIRTSHNPHSECLYDLCDELGFYCLDEAFDEWEGPKNKWWQGHNVYPPKRYGYFEDFKEWYERDIKAMVNRDRNHASVIMWSIGNEVDYPNDPYAHPMFSEMTGNNDANKPKEERIYSPDRPNMERLSVIAAYLAKVVKEADPTRPVSVAAAFPELSSHLGFFDELDVIGYNYKEQYYDEDHKRFPDKPILGSENSHSLEAWKAVTDRPFISGQFLWTGIDYLGEAHGWPVHGSPAGLLDVGGFEKPGFYFRKSLWATAPFVYILTESTEANNGPERIYSYRRDEKIRIIANTNENEATLYVNGENKGTVKKSWEYDTLSWEIPYEAGEIKVVTPNCSDVLKTAGAASHIELKCWSNGKEPLEAGKVIQLEAEAFDAEGNRVYTEESMLFVDVEGNGTLLGIENGNLADTTAYYERRRRMHRGHAIIYVRIGDGEGDIKINVRSRRFADAVAVIRA